MIITPILAVITASEIWDTWKTLKKPSSPGMRIASAILSVVIITFIGNAVPWYSEVNYSWWYALVAACSLHIGAVAWRIYTDRSEKSPKTDSLGRTA